MTNESENWDKEGTIVESNWFKFSTLKDAIKGTLVGKKFQSSSDPTFADQWIYQLKKEDGSVWNVGISVNKQGTIDRLNKLKIGEIAGIIFDSEGKPSKKGFHPAKNLKVYTFGMDENYNELDEGEEIQEPVVPQM